MTNTLPVESDNINPFGAKQLRRIGSVEDDMIWQYNDAPDEDTLERLNNMYGESGSCYAKFGDAYGMVHESEYLCLDSADDPSEVVGAWENIYIVPTRESVIRMLGAHYAPIAQRTEGVLFYVSDVDAFNDRVAVRAYVSVDDAGISRDVLLSLLDPIDFATRHDILEAVSMRNIALPDSGAKRNMQNALDYPLKYPELLNTEKTAFAQTPLMLAVFRGDAKKTADMLDAGAEVNTQDVFGNAALHIACLQEDARLALLLMERGADPHLRDERGRTAIEIAKKFRLNELATAMEAGAIKQKVAHRREPSSDRPLGL